MVILERLWKAVSGNTYRVVILERLWKAVSGNTYRVVILERLWKAVSGMTEILLPDSLSVTRSARFVKGLS